MKQKVMSIGSVMVGQTILHLDCGHSVTLPQLTRPYAPSPIHLGEEIDCPECDGKQPRPPVVSPKETLVAIRKVARRGRVTIASQSATEDLSEHVNEVLRILGHEEALITDESCVSHFLDFGDRPYAKEVNGAIQEFPGDPAVTASNIARLASLETEFGFPVTRSDRIVAIARRLKMRGKG
jgi:hypothetical protein